MLHLPRLVVPNSNFESTALRLRSWAQRADLSAANLWRLHSQGQLPAFMAVTVVNLSFPAFIALLPVVVVAFVVAFLAITSTAHHLMAGRQVPTILGQYSTYCNHRQCCLSYSILRKYSGSVYRNLAFFEFNACTSDARSNRCLSHAFWVLLTYQITFWRRRDSLSQFFRFLFFSSPCSNWSGL